MPYFKGAARQRGRGLGTLALAVGRTAYPIFKKFVLPTAKRLGKAALESAAPELLELASGRSKPKASLKRIAKSTLRSQLGGGSGGRRRTKTATKRKTKTKKKRVIRKKATTKGGGRRSAVDLFSNLR